MEAVSLIRRVLIANRGEIAIRISRACSERGIRSVAVYSLDDESALHRSRADEAVALQASGAAAYLDQEALIAAAVEAGCDAVHPGYGFLAENATFARACGAANLTFVGPDPETLMLFGDKARAIETARACHVPVVEGTSGPTTLADAQAFFATSGHDGMMIKAVAGGGGRGMRAVYEAHKVKDAWESCVAEAMASFGNGKVYAEALIGSARHIEIQIVGDGTCVTHLFDRECSVQRRHQKLIEIAPSPWLPAKLRSQLVDDAVKIGESVKYKGVGTVEFLVEIDGNGISTGRYYFIELNPRIQVEHTVTEEVMSVDLVHAQLRLAAGEALKDLGWPSEDARRPRGFAIQLRVNMELVGLDGQTVPSSGTLNTFDPPSGHGIRVETLGYQGLTAGSAFDSLLAKVVAYSQGPFDEVVVKADRALGEFRIGGVSTNIALLRGVLSQPSFREGRVHTRYVDTHASELTNATPDRRQYHPDIAATFAPNDDPADDEVVAGSAIRSPMQGQVVSYAVEAGDWFKGGQVICTLEAMKMEHAVRAEGPGRIVALGRPAGASVALGAVLALVDFGCGDGDCEREEAADQSDAGMNKAIAEFAIHHHDLLDEARPEAVALAERRGALTARARIDLLIDPGTFSEIGGLAHNVANGLAAPADGVIVGRAAIDSRLVLVLSQDFSVLGGSAGHLGMAKMERLADLALRHGLPLVMLLDGGGHRIQDGQNSRDYAVGAPLFQRLVDLSGWVPVVAAVLGAGFAANTNFAGCADFVIMVRGRAVMGLAGPALVKAGTAESATSEFLGGAAVQVDRHGLAHLGVADEAEALSAIRTYLGYLPSNAALAPPRADADDIIEPDGGELANIVPANTRRAYDVRAVIAHVADVDSFFEIKPTHATNMVVGFARMAGRPVGFIANQPLTRAGMLDAPACEKAAHFVSVCDAFGLPLIYLIDVPGFSIGTGAESSLLGRRSARMIHELGNATVPRISIVLRKGYGLGYVAMCGGRSFAADLALGWPTAEICAMSIEGSVDVAYRKKYEHAADPEARRQELIEEIRSNISPLQAAGGFGLDDIVAPEETRSRIILTLASAPQRHHRTIPGVRRISPI